MLKKIAKQKTILLIFTCLISACTNNATKVDKFYYDYIYDLFDDFEVNLDEKGNIGITEYFECSFLNKDIEKTRGVAVHENEPVLPYLNKMPNVDPTKMGLPFYKIVGLYKDATCTEMYENDELIKANSSLKEIHFLVKTVDEFKKENMIPTFFNGKWMNKEGMKIVIKFPSLKLDYKGHSLTLKFDANGSINRETIKIDNKKVDNHKEFSASTDYDLLCGPDKTAPKNNVCSYFDCWFVEQFIEYIGLEVETDTLDFYYDYIQFRSPYKGVKYSF